MYHGPPPRLGITLTADHAQYIVQHQQVSHTLYGLRITGQTICAPTATHGARSPP